MGVFNPLRVSRMGDEGVLPLRVSTMGDEGVLPFEGEHNG